MSQFEVLIPDGRTPSGDPKHITRWGFADSISQVRSEFPGCVVLELKDIEIGPSDIQFDLRARNSAPASPAVPAEGVDSAPTAPVGSDA